MAQKPHVVVDKEIHEILQKEAERKDGEGTPIYLQVRKYLSESPSYQKIKRKWG